MKVLVVYAHPDQESFCGELNRMVADEVRRAGHELRHRDLVAEGFNPVFSPYERIHHVGNIDEKLEAMPELRSHVDDLQWCDTLIFVYPTWWSGQPAILKGWFDRVLMNDVAWTLPEGKARLSPLLTNITRLVAVTSHGSTRWVNVLQGQTGKRTLFRSVRLMMSLRTRCTWIGLYGLDKKTGATEHQRLLSRAQRRLRRVLS